MKKSKSVPPPPPQAPSHADIAALAHSYWVAEGCPDGAECLHWLRAEAVLISAAKTPPKGKE